MNVILILNDSLRRDRLSCYGDEWIKTPNLARLAESSAVFERTYIGSYATIPARTDVYTGRYTFLDRPWSPLQARDVILPEILAAHGYTSMIIFDTPEMGQDGFNFMRGFAGWEMVRGQHTDRWRTYPLASLDWPAAPHKLKDLDRTIQWMRHKALWRYEKDYVTARTFSAAIEWLERNQGVDGFFLWIDTLDPHEPFDPPEHYANLYGDPGYKGEKVIYPQYGRSTYLTDAELNYVKALYAGEVTYVDRWIGFFLDKIEQLGLLDNTLIIHTSDHGHLFGEHNLQGKPGGLLGNLYEVTTRIPLMIRHPQGLGAGTRISAIVQLPDLLPTILDFLGISLPETVQGCSLWPLITGEMAKLHEYAFSGRYPFALDDLQPAQDEIKYDRGVGVGGIPEALTVTDESWSLLCSPRGRASELYNLSADPGQTKDILADNIPTAARLQQALLAFMESHGAPRSMINLWSQPAGEMVAPLEDLLGVLGPEDKLYQMQDSRGQSIAFLSKTEASKRLATEVERLDLKATTFRTVLEENPRNLIHMGGQYYWAQDLA